MGTGHGQERPTAQGIATICGKHVFRTDVLLRCAITTQAPMVRTSWMEFASPPNIHNPLTINSCTY